MEKRFSTGKQFCDKNGSKRCLIWHTSWQKLKYNRYQYTRYKHTHSQWKRDLYEILWLCFGLVKPSDLYNFLKDSNKRENNSIFEQNASYGPGIDGGCTIQRKTKLVLLQNLEFVTNIKKLQLPSVKMIEILD